MGIVLTNLSSGLVWFGYFLKFGSVRVRSVLKFGLGSLKSSDSVQFGQACLCLKSFVEKCKIMVGKTLYCIDLFLKYNFQAPMISSLKFAVVCQYSVTDLHHLLKSCHFLNYTCYPTMS